MNYKLRYYSDFYDIHKNKYRVEIYKNTNDAIIAKELILSSDAVTIQYSSDDLFQPLKQSGCTINVLTKDVLTDLYTGKLNEITCKILKDNSLFWYGFLTPNIYSSEYNSSLDLLSLKFIDVISQFDNIKYDHQEDSIESFMQILTNTFDIIDGNKIINSIYYPTSLKVSSNKILEELYAQTRNFFDESKDAETYRSVIEEIIRYLGMTLIQSEDKFLILDYAALKADNYTFNVYDRTTKETVQTILDGAVKDLYDDIGIAAANASISLGDVYNKVKIIANTNPNNVIFPDLFDDLVNQNEDSNKYYRTLYYKDKIAYDFISAYYNSKKWGTTKPIDSDNNIVEEVTKDNIANIYKGSFYQKTGSVKMGDTASSINATDSLIAVAPPSGTTFSPYRFVSFGDNNTMLSAKKGMLILSFDYLFSNHLNPDEDDDTKWGGENGQSVDFTCKLKIGDYYYSPSRTDGTDANKYWKKAEGTFKVTFSTVKDQHIFNNWQSVDNRVSYSSKIKDASSGWAINLPTDFALIGNIVLEILTPTYLGTNTYNGFYIKYCQLKNLSLKYAAYDADANVFNVVDNDNTNDILYENSIDDNNVTEIDDITFKVNTFSEKESSFSYVLCKNETDDYDFIESINGKKMEERMVERYVDYYSTPKFIYSNTLNNSNVSFITKIHERLLNKDMIVDSLIYNLADDNIEVTLKEL